MDIKEESFETEDEIIDTPDFVELTSLEEIKLENTEVETQPETKPIIIELKCEHCNEKFRHELSLKIHEMLHSTTKYCFLCKKTLRLNFHNHVQNRHMNHICEICDKVFTLKKSLDIHVRSHTKERIFKCGRCDKSFMQRGALYSHITYTHEGIKPYLCEICEGTFTTSSSLKKHVKKMHSRNEIYECRICCEKFWDKKKKIDHEKNHTLSKECKECGIVFPKTDVFARHLMMKHFNTEECIYCEKMFHKSYLDAHIVETHQPRDCDVCSATFYDVKSFKSHQISHKVKVTCTLCGKDYAQENLEKHLQLHRENKIKNCKICKNVYLDIDKHNLLVHKNTKYAFCHLCPKKFLSRSSKSQHVFRVHLKKLRKHQCNFCGKRFNEAPDLRVHVNAHYRLRPYKCLMCKRGFKYFHGLENHKKQHDEKRAARNGYKYKCTACGKSYKIIFSLKSHKCVSGKNKCGICNVKYKDKHYLKRHQITYHSPTIITEDDNNDLDMSTLGNFNYPQDTTRIYQCKKCHKVLTHIYTFKKHFCDMHQAAGYVCTFCHRRYKNKKDVVQHIEQKHPEKKLQCDICGFKSVNKVIMRNHFVRVHVLNKDGKETSRSPSDNCVPEVKEEFDSGDAEIEIGDAKINFDMCQ